MADLLTSPPASPFYVVGGTMQRDARSYVERRADHDIYDALARGEFCHVLTARQMGKSSLMVRCAARLRDAGFAVALLDLQAAGRSLTLEQWYAWLLRRLGQHLGLREELTAFWTAHQDWSPFQRWTEALQEVVLPQRPRVVIFVDEIDYVRSISDFSTDEFFAGIRELYMRRAQHPALTGLGFCLLGVATPSDLIRDPRVTPFNIGRRIELTDFEASEIRPLLDGLHRDSETGRRLLDRVMYWTGGHPYLTQRFCHDIVSDPAVTDIADVDRVCRSRFLASGARERDDNLLFVGARLLDSEGDRSSVLDVYGRVCRGKTVANDDKDPVVNTLKLAGIVRVTDGDLRIRNRIYQRVFDLGWIRDNTPDAELRRQRVALQRGRLQVATSALVVVGILGLMLVSAIGNAREARRLTQVAQEQTKKARAAAVDADTAKQAALRAQAGEREGAEQLGQALVQVRLEKARAEDAARSANSAKADAESNALAATRRAIDLFEEQGRQEFLKNEYEANQQAVSYLAAAYRETTRARITPRASLRFLLARALNQLEMQGPLLRGHLGAVTATAFDPQTRRVATASTDGTAKLWDLATGQLLRSISHGRRNPIVHVAFSADGARIATASSDGTVVVSTVADGTAVPLTGVHFAAVNFVVFSPNPRSPLVATAASDRTAMVWNATTGARVSGVLQHGDEVRSVRFNSTGDRLVSASTDQTAKIWTAEGRPVLTLSDPTLAGRQSGAVLDARFSPDGALVLSQSTDGRARLWDAATGKRLATFPTSAQSPVVTASGFSPDGTRIATGDAAGTVRVWNVDRLMAGGDRETLSLAAHTGPVGAVEFSANGAWIISGGDRSGKIWDAVSGSLLRTLGGHEDRVLAATFSADNRFAITTSRDKTARVWNLDRAGLPLVFARHSSPIEQVAVSRDAHYIATAGRDGTASVWNTIDGRSPYPPLRHDGTDFVLQATFSPDSKALLTLAGKQPVLWDVETGRRLLTFTEHQAPVLTGAFSPDGAEIVTAGQDDWILWDAKTGAVRGRPQTPSGERIRSVTTHPGGTWLLTVGTVARLWHLPDGRMQTTFSMANVQAATFSPDGSAVLTGDATGNVRVYDVIGNLTREVAANDGRITSIAFSPDGEYFATASVDRTAKIWRSESGVLVAALRGHTSAVRFVQFSPDSQLVMTTSDDATARVWDSASGRLLSEMAGHHEAVQTGGFDGVGRAATRMVTAGADGTARLWDVGYELSTAARIAATVDDRVPYHFVGARLLPGALKDVALMPVLNRVDGSRGDGPASVAGDFGRHAEAGRVSVLQNDWPTALGELADAYQFRGNWPSMRFLLSRVTSRFAGLLASVAPNRERINTIQVSPDGEHLVTASMDRTVGVVNTKTREVTRLVGHGDWVLNAEFSPDGRSILSNSRDGTVRLWNASDGRPIRVLGHPLSVASAHFTPDGTRIVSACDDGYGRVWNAGTGMPLLRVGPHPTRVVVVATSGRDMVTGDAQGNVKLWDLASGKERLQLTSHAGGITDALFTRDGRRMFVSSADGTVREWDVLSGALVWEAKRSSGIRAVSLNADETELITGHDNGDVNVWLPGAMDPALIVYENSQVLSAAFSPDGRLLLIATAERVVNLRDAYSGDLVSQFGGGGNNYTIAAFISNGERVVSASGPAVRFWTIAPMRPESTAIFGSVAAAGFEARGRLRVAKRVGDRLELSDDVNRVLAALPISYSRQKMIAPAVDGIDRGLAAASDDEVTLWDWTTGRRLGPFGSSSGRVIGLAYNARAARLAVAREDRVTVYSTVGDELARLDERASTVAFDPKATRLAVGGVDGALRIWNLVTKRVDLLLEEHFGGVLWAGFSQDGSTIGSVSQDGTARIWRASDGRAVATLTAKERMTGGAISRDGTLLATAMADGTVQIWDVASARLLYRYSGFRRLFARYPLVQLAFTDDGRQLVGTNENGDAWLMNTAGEERSRTAIGALQHKVLTVLPARAAQ